MLGCQAGVSMFLLLDECVEQVVLCGGVHKEGVRWVCKVAVGNSTNVQINPIVATDLRKLRKKSNLNH